MPPLALLLPVALPLVAGGVAVAAGRINDAAGRAAAAIGAWSAAAAILALWLPVRSTLDLSVGTLGFGVALTMRLDAVAVVFGLVILIPVASLLTLQACSWQESAVASIGVAAALLATQAGDVVLTAFAGCTAATLAVIGLGIEDLGAPRPVWAILLAAWLGLAWAGVQLQVTGGTAGYAVVPVSALTWPVFVLIAFAAVAGSGLYPWRGWASRIWSRPTLRAAAVAVATLQPLGLYLLFRAYEMGNGRYPQPVLNIALGAWGVLVALGAASRAQAASTRRQYMSEVLPGIGGFALLFAAVGSSLGLVAALIVLAAAALLVVSLPLLADTSGPPSLLVVAGGAGMPAGLAFGGLVLGLDAAFEAGGAFGLIGLAGVAAWLLAAAAAARSVRLPSGSDYVSSGARPGVAALLAAIALAAGPALGLVFAAGAAAAADVVDATGPAPGTISIVTVSTVLPAVTLLGPLLVFGAAALLIARPMPQLPRLETHQSLFSTDVPPALTRAWALLRSAAVPSQYRSLVNPRALEAAAAGGTPLLWLASLLALCIAVTR